MGDAKVAMKNLETDLSTIVGMKLLKQQLRVWAKGYVMDEKRRKLGVPVCQKKPPHMAFLGSPGVGKTSMARILGKLLNNLGILPTDRVVEVQRTDLVGEYIGQTGPKTKLKIKEPEGGILFVDEAYQLMVPKSPNDFGKEALEEIMHSMESGKLCIIFAGYVKEMKRVFHANEGFRRRVSTCFVFEDFTCEELAQILHSKITKQGTNLDAGTYCGYRLSNSCSITAMAELIKKKTTKEQRETMNGGLIDQMLAKAKENLDLRLDVNCVDIKKLTTFRMEDLTASLGLLKNNHSDVMAL